MRPQETAGQRQAPYDPYSPDNNGHIRATGVVMAAEAAAGCSWAEQSEVIT